MELNFFFPLQYFSRPSSSMISWSSTQVLVDHWGTFCAGGLLVGSVKVNFLSYRYRADKSTIFGMRGLWGLTINSGRGATLKYLQDGRKNQKSKMAPFLARKVIISASKLLRKAWLGSKLGDSDSGNPFMWVSN